MQTFLPYADFQKTAECLDFRRLGKQRVEAKQILNCLLDNSEKSSKGWSNHPAVKMWSGYEEALKLYHNTMISEWIHRGYKNNMPMFEIDESNVEYPPWFGVERFHESHQSNLMRKNYFHYLEFFGEMRDDLNYVWPTKDFVEVE